MFEIPSVLTHVPHEAFQAMWGIAKEHVTTGDTPESYFEMLKRLGQTDAELGEVIRQHDVYWEDAVALVHDTGGVEPHIQAGVERSSGSDTAFVGLVSSAQMRVLPLRFSTTGRTHISPARWSAGRS